MNFIIRLLKLYIERRDFFMKLLIEHIILSLIAIVFITIIGILIGVMIAKKDKFANIVLSIVNFIYTIPSIALFGILVSIIGIGSKSALFALIIYGLLPMIRNTYVGIKEVDKYIIESSKAMGSTDIQLLLKIEIPLAMPIIISGFRTMVIMTIALTGIASFIGAGGLGVAIWRGITTYYPEMTVAGSLLVAILAVMADFFIGKIENLITIKIYGVRDKKIIGLS